MESLEGVEALEGIEAIKGAEGAEAAEVAPALKRTSVPKRAYVLKHPKATGGSNVLKSIKTGDLNPTRANEAAQYLSRILGVRFKSFTKANYRYNLKMLDQAMRETVRRLPPGMHAHHLLPQQLAEKFAERGINVHDPRLMAWMDSSAHAQLHNGSEYNMMWDKFLDGDNITQQEILNKMYEIIKNNGLDWPYGQCPAML